MQIPYRGSGKIHYNSKEYRCDLYYSENLGGIVLKINTVDENSIGDFLQFPLEIACLSGELDSGFKFTLLDLMRTGMQNLISYGKSVYTFHANYLLSGIGLEDQSAPSFHKVQYTLSNIIAWGNESAYIIGENYELISKPDDVRKPIFSGEDVTITYIVRGTILPIVDHELLNETISLEQHGVIEICLKSEKPLHHFNIIFEQLRRLIEIASFRKINVEKVYAYSNNILYSIGDKTIERAVDIYGINILENKVDENPPSHPWKWIALQELIDHNSIALYFEKQDKLAPIIELFLEPFYADNCSETRVFLNIVQALETYHSRFVTNSLDDYKVRVKSLTECLPASNAKQQKKFLLAKSKYFITLESRMADLLLANHKIYFDTGEIKHIDFPSVVAHTRNYYIHYDESIKTQHRVFSEEELQFYNRSLLQILEYYILLELGFSENDASIKRRLTDRWGNISQDLEILRISRSQ